MRSAGAPPGKRRRQRRWNRPRNGHLAVRHRSRALRTKRLPPAPPPKYAHPALAKRLAEYWTAQGREARIFWFQMAGFHIAYSAPTWPSLVQLVPEMAAAIADAIVWADFPPDVGR